jgi:hypothetical protein
MTIIETCSPNPTACHLITDPISHSSCRPRPPSTSPQLCIHGSVTVRTASSYLPSVFRRIEFLLFVLFLVFSFYYYCYYYYCPFLSGRYLACDPLQRLPAFYITTILSLVPCLHAAVFGLAPIPFYLEIPPPGRLAEHCHPRLAYRPVFPPRPSSDPGFGTINPLASVHPLVA